MAFSISTNGLRCIRTYKQALQHYENIKPIRGSYNLLPIGPRAKKHMSIHQLFNGDISCRLYSTDCVVYHQDDSITVNFGGWNTMSTSAFVNAILPQGLYAQAISGYIHTPQGSFKVPSEGLKILPDGTPVNPVQEYRTLLDKKKAAETRKKLKPFLDWVEACKKLGGEFDYNNFDYNRMQRVLDADQEIFDQAAGYYFKWAQNDSTVLFKDAYRYTGSFLEIPVPLGTERRPTQWD